MSECRSIVQVLKECGTSRIVKCLEPDRFLPSAGMAKDLYESQDAESAERKVAIFHTPRPVQADNGHTPHFSFVAPEKRPFYKFMVHSPRALDDLGLTPDEELKKICQGEAVISDESRNIFPYSLAYAGFQFGEFAGQLGDGRVVNLFDVKDQAGDWQTLQLKGSGMTPFSRFADGKAVMRSSIREFVISEALNAIGIPSSRSLQISSLPRTRAKRSTFEPCAVVARFAPTWIRIGNFDLFRWKRDDTNLLRLSDYCIDEVFDGGKNFPIDIDLNSFRFDHFRDPEEKEESAGDHVFQIEGGMTKYDLLYRHIVNLNAECVAYWQTYGFCNGVLNTDNTSIMGVSIDFGPFGFMDKFEPNYTPNHDDVGLRYSFANQPSVIWWNLVKLGEALVIPLGVGTKYIDALETTSREEWSEEEIVNLSERATAMINLSGLEYKFRFTVKYADLMAKRLGIELDIPKKLLGNSLDDVSQKVMNFNFTFVEPLLRILRVSGVDYNHFFLNLQNYEGPFVDESGINGLDAGVVELFFRTEQVQKLNEYYAGKEANDSGETRKLVEEAELLSKWVQDYVKVIPEYSERHGVASKVNPQFVPRNYILEEVINHYTEEQRNALNDPEAVLDNRPLEKLVLMSTFPYDKNKWNSELLPELETKWTATQHDEQLLMSQCSCSS